MVRQGQTIDRMFAAAPILAMFLAMIPLARAGDDATARLVTTAAPLAIPHVTDLLLAEKARKHNRNPGNIENYDFLVLAPGFKPLSWPRNSDLRARLLTPQLKSTPVVGWFAENLYRSKDDDGWCLELDPGGGEYVVFYRFHPRK